MHAPRFQLIHPSSFKRTPWKNGLGWTDEIAIHPEGADLRRGDFDWRISTARIGESSRFSPFPEHDRVLVVLEGAGVRLTHERDEDLRSKEVTLAELEPYEFPGDVPTRCELVGGPIRDLSVFARRGVVTARVASTRLGKGERFEWNPQAPTSFVLVSRGTASVRGELVRPGEVLRIDLTDPPENPLRLDSDEPACLLLVEVG